MNKRIPIGGVRLSEAQATEFRMITNLVRDALGAKRFGALPAEQRPWVCIEAIYPDAVVIEDGGKSFRYPYTIDAQNVVTVGDPVEVMETYVPVRESCASGDEGPFIEAAGAADGTGGRWLIRVIRAGLSLNGNYYPDSTLREAAPLFEGVRVYLKPDIEHVKGSAPDFNKLVGALQASRFVEGATPDTGEVQAEFVLIEPSGPVNTKLTEAYSRGLSSLFGFSIDANAKIEKTTRAGKRVREAKRLLSVSSVDLIVEPGAGGELIRLIEAVDPRNLENEVMNREEILRMLKAKAPTVYAKLGADATDEQLREALDTALSGAASGGDRVAEAAARAERALEEIRLVDARSRATSLIVASTLPQAAKDKLTADFGARERFVEADVSAAIESERAYLARFVESGKAHYGDFEVEDLSVKTSDMLAAFFDPKHKDHKAVGSIREAYVVITGDRNVTGEIARCNRGRMAEALGVVREALDTTSFANALGNSITRQMQDRFTGLTNLQLWRQFCRVGRVSDFRTQERIRIGGYGNLPTVAESGSYNALTSPSDAKATYAAVKRGGTESVTREMILADDVNAIRAIPDELALTAANTLHEFVFDFFRTNPNIHDGNALFTAPRGNLFTGALSAAEFAAHRLAMKKQTRAGSAKRLGLTPSILLVPDDLEELAFNLFVRSTNNDKTFVQGINPQVIAVSYWTDANDWCTVTNPAFMKPIEVSFLNGQEDPELFVQDMPNVGSLFSNDKITYKIRHEYGGAVLVDGEKGVTKAVVP